MQWIAPFAAFTMAEYFRDRGQHALIVIDDLTKHAATHREIALLTRQSPGREAYPGDVFYVHARLLERAAKLSKEKGGGSLTALPIAETDAGNSSGYIPTNLISITDGQIVLDARLFHEGQKPAVDVGTSVSRVGGKTQAPALREAAEMLRLDYAQFLELETFTRFGGMPDTASARSADARRANSRRFSTNRSMPPCALPTRSPWFWRYNPAFWIRCRCQPWLGSVRVCSETLDDDVPDIVHQIQRTGALDDAGKRAIRETLRKYMFDANPDPGGCREKAVRHDGASLRHHRAYRWYPPARRGRKRNARHRCSTCPATRGQLVRRR